jgi:hypothetical protein
LIGLMAQRALEAHPGDPVVATFAFAIAGILLVGAVIGLWMNSPLGDE